MEVILLKPIKNKGRLGDTITVKDGYALNHLIPKGVVLPSTPQNIKRFQSIKNNSLKNLEDQKQVAEKLIEKLKGKSIALEAQTHKGSLYGSVTPKDVEDAIKDQLNISVSKDYLTMPAHIKTVGTHIITIDLHQDISTDITLTITSNSEVEEPVSFEETDEGIEVAEQTALDEEKQRESVEKAVQAQEAEAEEEAPVEENTDETSQEEKSDS